MTVPAGVFQRYQGVGMREDLSDIIYDISPVDTPFMSNIKRGKATSTLHEWQTDTLASAVATNQQVEGDDYSGDTASPTSRWANYAQIFSKVPRVSGTLRASDTAGRKDELSYQIAKRGKELKRDMESSFLANSPASAGSASTARKLAGAPLWIFNNTTPLGSTATTPIITSGTPISALTAGTTATYTELHLKAALKQCWDDGGDPNMVLVGSYNKQINSAFAGIATQYRDNQQNGPATIIGAADVYVHDFGTVSIVADRFSVAGNVLVVDSEMWEVNYLRPIQQLDLAKTGDSDRKLILTECTLSCLNPDANAKVYSTATS